MKQYPTNALDFLNQAEGLMTAVCAVYYQNYLQNNKNAEDNFRIFCDNINFLMGGATIPVKNEIPPEEYRKAYDKNKGAVSQIVDNLQSRNDTEEVFYKELWNQLQNTALFPTDIEKVAALVQLSDMPQIPYFHLDNPPEMDDETYKHCTQEVLPYLKKAIFAINCGCKQKTQLADQLIGFTASITDTNQKKVFVAQVIALYEQQIHDLLKKLQPKEDCSQQQTE